MNKSRSFDRAANYYDQTRLLLEPIEKYGIPAIQDIAGPGARLLEVGAGTGRMSIPLLERGADVVACDLSSPMLNRFQEKYPSARIAQVDASYLPFPSAHFDTVVTVHVMHLIPAWRDVLREFRRVLVPKGTYLNVKTWATSEDSVADKIREFWRGWLKERGVDAGHPGVRDNSELQQELRLLGADLSHVEVVRFPDSFSLREELDRFESRIYSETWDIEDAIFQESIRELRLWAGQQFRSLDQQIEEEVRFVINVARFSD